MNSLKRVLLVSVGGTPEQTIKSIGFNKCEYVIFFCSKETYRLVPEIRDEAAGSMKIKEYERIVTDSSEDMGKCYRAILQRLPTILDLWGMNYEDMIVDYTGGTKTMTSALVLATIEYCNKYSYVGGEDRTKNGVGVVIGGQEKFYYQENPWDELAIGELKVIESLFSKSRYASVVEYLQKIKSTVDSRLKETYDTLCKLCTGYYEWDNFDHSKAKKSFDSAFHKFEGYLILNNGELNQLITGMRMNYKWLCTLKAEICNTGSVKGYRMLCADLISNAMRRADNEQKYDDAVARLYSAIEKIIKSHLLEYGIDNSCTEKKQVPASLQEQFSKHEYFEPKSGKRLYKYGFKASCELLSERNSDFKAKYNSSKGELEKLMNIRNGSILAHGTSPISEDLYKRMLKIAIDFANIDTMELVEFPDLNINKWGGMLLRD